MFSPRKTHFLHTFSHRISKPSRCWAELGEEPRGSLRFCGQRWQACIWENISRSIIRLDINDILHLAFTKPSHVHVRLNRL